MKQLMTGRLIRLQFLSDGMKLEECMNIGMCSVTCPKDLNPREAIQDLIRMVEERRNQQWMETELI